MNTLLNFYLKAPLRWDAFLSILATISAFLLKSRLGIDAKDITSVQNSLASTAVSLAGFILTALTIIVTLRANLSYKGLEESSNGLELILNSWAYKKIVNIFKGAILELVLIALFLYATMLVSKQDSYEPYILSVSFGTLLLIALTVLRCLYVLFNLVELEITARENADKPMPKPKKWRITLGHTTEAVRNNQPIPDDFTVEMLEQEVEDIFKPFG
jgi:hypothetical protein